MPPASAGTGAVWTTLFRLLVQVVPERVPRHGSLTLTATAPELAPTLVPFTCGTNVLLSASP